MDIQLRRKTFRLLAVVKSPTSAVEHKKVPPDNQKPLVRKAYDLDDKQTKGLIPKAILRRDGKCNFKI